MNVVPSILRLAGFSCSPFDWRPEQVERGRTLLSGTRRLALEQQEKSRRAKKLVLTIDATFDNLENLLKGGTLKSDSMNKDTVKKLKLFGCCDKHLAPSPTAPCTWARIMVVSIWRHLTMELLFPEHTRKFIQEYKTNSLIDAFDRLDQIFANQFPAPDFESFVHVAMVMAVCFINNLGSYLISNELLPNQVLSIVQGIPLSNVESSESTTRFAILTSCVEFFQRGGFDPSGLGNVSQSMQPKVCCDELFDTLSRKKSTWIVGDPRSTCNSTIEFNVNIENNSKGVVNINFQAGM